MADIVDAAKKENLKTLLEAIELTELQETLTSPGSFTVFAPTDEAFAKLPEGLLDSLKKDVEKFKRIVAYHVGFGDVRAEDLSEIEEVMTMEGSIVAVEASDGQIKLNDAKVVTSDIVVDNGVIHIIDRVLIPTLVMSE
ncbi:MAG: fasciclin domain-containing protein [Hydrococcus sp. Prado102]|jgi:uncharacterized surface protein with fasciclin (FAS1) repeats|nr:fasciclin domain-containing protein [Hydrococcus sp. Prado102]